MSQDQLPTKRAFRNPMAFNNKQCWCNDKHFHFKSTLQFGVWSSCVIPLVFRLPTKVAASRYDMEITKSNLLDFSESQIQQTYDSNNEVKYGYEDDESPLNLKLYSQSNS